MQVFRVWPKRIRRGNGQVISPEMVVIVTLKHHATTPFAGSASEVKAAFMNIYRCDISKLGCNPNDFNYTAIG